MDPLNNLLHATFGFPEFRENQRQVCEAAVAGRDVLLVMPTGAGKSLCYQLPAVARGGTALVVSPLIALMDDQAAKLSALGLRVGRIHSGMDREASRQTCREYLDGTLQFLFIAPERLRVPGFAAMLAKRKLSLIAIDEAHCISQWGHDFRPDYRMLGQYLADLRPAPVIALTATATPTVQKDIVVQLNLKDTALFIHGFRRTNLAVEIVEVSKPRRNAKVHELLADPERRPAILYAPSRAGAEQLAEELSPHFPTSAYHAGLEPAVRERVQTAFLGGKLEVVVATVAFGMGIDKADVRTVIHTAAPTSIEAFYQEIGRAGRDGKPCRSVLMYSFLDRKTHEFFLDRSYPPMQMLRRIEAVLPVEGTLYADELRLKSKLPPEDFHPALDRLTAEGVVSVDYNGMVSAAAASPQWRANYERQVSLRREQMDRMMQFAAGTDCRMASLVRYFGDSAKSCGICDVCSPERSISQSFREPSDEEQRHFTRILNHIGDRGISTRKLNESACPSLERSAFETLLAALVRAGYVSTEETEFRNAEGESIRYRKATLTHEGREWDGGRLEGILLQDKEPLAPSTRSAKPRSAPKDDAPLSTEEQTLANRLRNWRRSEAGKLGKPPFVVFGDRTLHELARRQPRSKEDLLEVSGMGPAKVERWGEAICSVLKEA